MPNLNFEKARTALLSMDFHERVVRGAAAAMGRETTLVENARRALEGARKAAIVVIHVGVRPRPAFSTPRNKFQKRIRERLPVPPGSTPEQLTQVAEPLRPVGDEPMVHKPRINAFYGSELQALLQSRDIHTLVLMGVTTEFVVQSTARYAVDSDYRVIILEDCCAALSEEAHKASIALLDWMAEISNASEFLESLAEQIR